VARDDQDDQRRLLVPVKNNLAADDSGLAYRLDDRDGAAVVAWEDQPIHVSADQALAPPSEGGEDGKRTERAEAADWLREALSDGPIATRELQRMARDAGPTWIGLIIASL